jgi:hypothetical protein
MRPRSRVLVPLATLLFLGGCAEVPADRIERAYAAQATAVAAGAAEHAREGYASMAAYRNALDAELEAQARRLAVFRSYGRASQVADSLWRMAEAVTTMAGERHAAYRMEAGTLLSDGAQAARDLVRDLARTPASQIPDAAEWRAMVAAAEAALAEARAAFDAGNSREARDQAAEAVHSLFEVRTHLDRTLDRQGDR